MGTSWRKIMTWQFILLWKRNYTRTPERIKCFEEPQIITYFGSPGFRVRLWGIKSLKSHRVSNLNCGYILTILPDFVACRPPVDVVFLPRFLQRFIKICYKGRKNFADIWPLAPVPVVYIEVKNGFKTFFQRDLLEKTHILLFFSTRFLPFVHSLKKHLLK